MHSFFFPYFKRIKKWNLKKICSLCWYLFLKKGIFKVLNALKVLKVVKNSVMKEGENHCMLWYSLIPPLNFHIFIWKQIFYWIFPVMNTPTFEPIILYHLLKYWHQIVMNVNTSNNLYRTLSCLLSSNFWLFFFFSAWLFFPQNVPGRAEYTPCSKWGHVFEDITDWSKNIIMWVSRREMTERENSS